MTNAKHDENNRPTITAVLESDGVTVVPIYADKTSHALAIDDGVAGTDNGNNLGNAMIDENGVAIMTVLASDGSGEIIELYANSSNQLLIQTM